MQSPDRHVEWFVSVYKELNDTYPRHLREDFCGTFQLSCAWVKRNKKNTALGLDLDPIPLRYGKQVHRAKLTAEQRERMQVERKDVLKAGGGKKFDLVIACNFSFYIFKRREVLVDYFRQCLKSLRSGGIFVLEMAGGPGMQEHIKERKVVRAAGLPKFTYIWHQRMFDPISRDAQYAIHFVLEDGQWMKNSFVYDWRLWTIPEVREAMIDAGFEKTFVYWETEFKGAGTGEFVQTEQGDNAYAWIAYVVGTGVAAGAKSGGTKMPTKSVVSKRRPTLGKRKAKRSFGAVSAQKRKSLSAKSPRSRRAA